MNLVAQFVHAAAEAPANHGNVALETLPFGLIAAGVFTLLGLVAFSYRHVANRHAAKAEAWAAEHGHEGHGAGHGH
ncbi:hypothetical protein [Microbacterium capsulatum]|uniref:4-hydroxybenzoate polyprenyltransferase n=1 Tax=Microbacterium capsulatum TaxID=3041921 RepID=A0ABU0XD68_9MICO|nr:hypothetical protein [Microbacterium sp. ASV81]MDQ4213061.1 hypothetical protein [Microbacterium sp. ASV81]